MRYGYLNNAQNVEYAKMRNELEAFQCDLIFCDEEYSNSTRPAWRSLIDCLKENDEFFILSFGNAFCDLNSFFYFMRYIVLKHVRLVSVKDEIDTKGELFVNSNNAGDIFSHCFSVLGLLPLRIGKNRFFQKANTTEPEHKLLYKQKKNECSMKAVNMYAAGYTVDEIRRTLGYKTRKSIYDIIHKKKLGLRQPRIQEKNSNYPTMNFMAKKLKELGYKPDQIKKIIEAQRGLEDIDVSSLEEIVKDNNIVNNNK